MTSRWRSSDLLALQRKRGMAASEILPVVKRGSKYGAQRSIDARGMAHPSKAESVFANLIYLLESAGQITGLRQQVGLEVGGLRYRCDFMYCEFKKNAWKIVDVKGITTDRFRTICQLWKLNGANLGKQHFDTLTIANARYGRGGVTGWNSTDIVEEKHTCL